MPITISGSTGIAGVDGSASTPAVQGTDTNTGIVFPAADTVTVATGGSERMRVDSSGNVGIGTSSPFTYGLSVYKSSGVAGVEILSGANIGEFAISGTDLYVTNKANGPTQFWTNGSERARITSGGALLVGTTSSDPVGANTGAGVMAVGPGANEGALNYFNASGPCMKIARSSDGEIVKFFRNTSSVVQVGNISVTTTATAYNTSSDYRLKHDVAPLTTGLATIAALKPSTYKWNVNNSYGEGFIAHELQAVIPQAVSGEKDAVNENGSIKPQGVDYSRIVVHLVAAIQELTTKLESAEARIAALEAK